MATSKIVCTLGPAVASEAGIRELVDAGMDVARLNFSHGEHADHEANYRWVRQASDETGRAVGVLADLQGPKIRLGRFIEGRHQWDEGDEVVERYSFDEADAAGNVRTVTAEVVTRADGSGSVREVSDGGDDYIEDDFADPAAALEALKSKTAKKAGSKKGKKS